MTTTTPNLLMYFWLQWEHSSHISADMIIKELNKWVEHLKKYITYNISLGEGRSFSL